MMKRLLSIMLACLFSASGGAGSDGIAEAIKQEHSSDYSIDDVIPAKYLVSCNEQGTITEITYTAKDYYKGDGSEYTKRAMVYLPYGYTSEKKYKVLVLCHGIGGNEYEWGMTGEDSQVKRIMDNLICAGEIEPFIVVTPNGRAGDMSRKGLTQNDATASFYLFGQEIRNDLLPYIEKNYSTYAAEDNARDYRAMAGLSMGGMQTINIGMCECLDLFSWYGVFSACPTTYKAQDIAEKIKAFPDKEIKYFYNICGTEDTIAITHATNAAKHITDYTDRINNDNWTWQELPGVHNFAIWYLGFFNFARIFGAK